MFIPCSLAPQIEFPDSGEILSPASTFICCWCSSLVKPTDNLTYYYPFERFLLEISWEIQEKSKWTDNSHYCFSTIESKGGNEKIKRFLITFYRTFLQVYRWSGETWKSKNLYLTKLGENLEDLGAGGGGRKNSVILLLH